MFDLLKSARCFRSIMAETVRLRRSFYLQAIIFLTRTQYQNVTVHYTTNSALHLDVSHLPETEFPQMITMADLEMLMGRPGGKTDLADRKN